MTECPPANRGRGGARMRGQGRRPHVPLLPPAAKQDANINRYQVLGNIPQPKTYSSTLAGPSDDPYAIQRAEPVPIKSYYSSTSRPVFSEYHPKQVPINLFFVEDHFTNKDDPIKLAQQFFPKNWHYTPLSPEKNINFFQDILLETKSVTFKPIYDNATGTKLLYHSVFIVHIIPMTSWGNHPGFLRKLTNQKTFSYYDYINAWTYAFLHQNETHSHSWFFNFDKEFASTFPAWFQRWWEVHGPTLELLPDELQAQLTRWKPLAHSIHNPSAPILLLFVSKFKIPWILKWQYTVPKILESSITQQTGTSTAVIETWAPYSIVQRQYFIKWWDKFINDRIIESVTKELEKAKLITPKEAPLTNLQVPPPLSELRVSTSTSSKQVKKSDSAVKGKGKALDHLSKKELKKALLTLMSKSDSDEDSKEEQVPQSSEESVTGRNREEDIYQDAQDPYA